MKFDKNLGGLALATMITAAISSPAYAVPFLAGDFLTYTQADWGDPIPLLTANYNTVYAPFGIFEIGIPGVSGFSIAFTSSAALAAFLPAIGPPGALQSDLADPIGSSSGQFGGDVAVLRLNVDFSDAGLITHLPGVPFGDLELTGFSGSLTGLNDELVRNFLGVINTALGGGATPYTIPDLDGVAQQLDGSFFGGIPLQWAQDHLALPAATTTSVPEPPTGLLLLFGLGALISAQRVKTSRFGSK